MSDPRVDRIFVEGWIWTGDPDCPRAQALAEAGGRVLAVGDTNSIRALAGRGTEVVGLDAAAVFPGFHDAHTHLSGGALLHARTDLRDVASADEAASRVAAAAESRPEGKWIRGWGWDHTRWPGARWPDRSLLDRAAPAHPVLLTRIDAHAVWVNGRALAILGIGLGSPDPAGGSIVRDAQTREPTGILLERAAEQATAAVPAESDEERRRALERALSAASRCGITALEDVAEPWAIPIYAALHEEGRLGARVSIWLPFDSDRAEAEEWRRRHPPADPWLSVATRKVFLDGTLGSRSAALDEPYADEPASRGILRVDPGSLAERVREADSGGWAIALHAIGDRALRIGLEVLSGLPPRARARPHRIEHVQVAAPEDLPRFASARALASVQPVHLVDDVAWVEERLGGERAARSYPLRSLLRAGARLAIGTDWPIAPLDPLRGIEAATSFRQRCVLPDPGEALTIEEAIRAYTAGSASGRGGAAGLGLLRPGFHADFVVLSEDPLAGPAGEIRERVRVLATYVGGERSV